MQKIRIRLEVAGQERRQTLAEITPMMQQYLKTKEEYKDCILFYRLGDFYEMFFDDALIASKELEIALTGKNCGLEERAPMCGVPYHAVEAYLNKLVSKGYKVAICEQVEDPKTAKGIVKREVIRVVTPGTNTDLKALDESRNNYIMCIVYIADRYGVSVADVSQIHTGAAVILANVDGAETREYCVRIDKLYPQAENGRNLLLTVTDERLLAITGGIVQGMSGSPILQDGRLIGAVTHVLVNRPEQGYGIFLQNMLAQCEAYQ